MVHYNSELFELPKMFFVWLMTVIIIGVWLIRCVAQRKLIFRRTILDIPLILFLISQSLSLFVSIDIHTSLWGYYGRFNGGLLSLIAYSVLYWAFVSNMNILSTIYSLRFLLASGLLVVLWGIPAHFGYDPTCFLITGNLNVACWSENFKPEARIFSTLGQPNWLAAWLVGLIPLTLTFALKPKPSNNNSILLVTYYLLLTILFLSALIFTGSRSGLLGFIVALLVSIFGFIWVKKKHFSIRVVMGILVIGSIIVATTPLSNRIVNPIISCTSILLSNNYSLPSTEVTPSSDIRCIVWKGAINIAKTYPWLGTGPETFAYSYYRFKPQEHSLTSEWNLLYNKAHNEYLGFAANTGAIGLINYLALILCSLILLGKTISKQIPMQKLKIGNLPIALLAGYISILITNFFGFSVVAVNLQFFLYPAIAVIISNKDKITSDNVSTTKLSLKSIIAFVVIILLTFYLIFNLIRSYAADLSYTKSERQLNEADLSGATQSIQRALMLRPEEPIYQGKLASIFSSVVLITATSNTTGAAYFTEMAKTASDRAIKTSPQNPNLWLSRAYMFTRLATLDPKYLEDAQKALDQAVALAPTDAQTLYEAGYFYANIDKPERSRELLEKAASLRPQLEIRNRRW